MVNHKNTDCHRTLVGSWKTKLIDPLSDKHNRIVGELCYYGVRKMSWAEYLDTHPEEEKAEVEGVEDLAEELSKPVLKHSDEHKEHREELRLARARDKKKMLAAADEESRRSIYAEGPEGDAHLKESIIDAFWSLFAPRRVDPQRCPLGDHSSEEFSVAGDSAASSATPDGRCPRPDSFRWYARVSTSPFMRFLVADAIPLYGITLFCLWVGTVWKYGHRAGNPEKFPNFIRRISGSKGFWVHLANFALLCGLFMAFAIVRNWFLKESGEEQAVDSAKTTSEQTPPAAPIDDVLPPEKEIISSSKDKDKSDNVDALMSGSLKENLARLKKDEDLEPLTTTYEQRVKHKILEGFDDYADLKEKLKLRTRAQIAKWSEQTGRPIYSLSVDDLIAEYPEPPEAAIDPMGYLRQSLVPRRAPFRKSLA